MNNEEKLEKMDSDAEVGFGIPGLSAIRKVASLPTSLASKVVRKLPGGSYADRLARAPMNLAKMPANLARRAVGAVVKKFVPQRDAQKAMMVKNLYGRLVNEHANWLGMQDQRLGRPVQSPAAYRQASVPWARQALARGGLPLSTSVSGADVLGSDILGDDVVGSWWNPLSWFATQTQVVINNTAGQRSAVGPDGQPVDPNAQYAQYDPSMDPNAQYDPNMDPNMQYDPNAQYDPSYDPGTQYDPYAYSQGDDTLGAFVGEVLGPDKKKADKPDELIARAVDKLRSGQGLTPGELAIVARLAKGGHPRATKLLKILQEQGTTSGAWAHKLNPLYWLKPKDERSMVDKEREGWIENARLQEELKKKQEVLTQAERARTAADAVAAAKAQAAATEAQLAAIKAQLSGDLVGGSPTLVGHEKPTLISDVVKNVLDKAGLLDKAKEIDRKIAKGEALDKDEVKTALAVGKALRRAKVVHGDLVPDDRKALDDATGAFVGAYLVGVVEDARAKTELAKKAATLVEAKVAKGVPLSEKERAAARKVGDLVARGKKVVRSCASGEAFVGLTNAAELRQRCVSGAAQAAMTPAEKKMLSAMQKMAKAGNPRAAAALANLRKTGAVVGGDHVGSFISDAFNWSMKPLKLPAQMLYKGAKWTGQQLGIVSKGGSSPEQARLARMRAAAQRRKAALAKAAAADAQTEAELRAQQSIADAADAEAEAADAEALAREAAMRTAENEAVSGEETFVGEWTDSCGAKEKKVLDKAAEKSPTGMKLRAGAAFYRKLRGGDPKTRAALHNMTVKANAGSTQARKDLNTIYAGRMAVLAKEKAKKKHAAKLAAKARTSKVRAVQKKLEAQAAQKIVEAERRLTLSKLSAVAKRASAGNKKARAYVQKQVVLAKRGDKKAASRVEGLKLAAALNKAAPTKRERRNVAQAGKLLAKARRGNVKAVRQVRVLQAAAKTGNPNARRAVKRLQTAALVSAAVTTGVVAVAANKKKVAKARKANAQKLTQAKTKLAAKTGTREEYLAGARAARELGDRASEGQLAVAAAQAPSATMTLRNAANVVAAKDAGNPEAKAAVAENLQAAKAGDPEAIRRTGNVVAAQTIADLEAGKPVSPAVRDAVNLQARAAEGDRSAQQVIKDVTEAATGENVPAEATMAAVTLAAAATTAKAMAGRPKAREEFLQKVNAVPASERPEAERELTRLAVKAKDGSITAEEGQRAVRIAERLGKPKVAAEVAAMAPPAPPSTVMSSLPDAVLPPITGVLDLVRESARALLLATRDPVGNYREGVASRSSTPTIHDVTGWSPFDYFKKKLPAYFPAVAAVSSTASLVAQLAKGGKKTPAPTPAQAPAPTVAEARTPTSPAEVKTPATAESGAEKTFRDYVQEALSAKTISRRDFNRAVEAKLGQAAEKTAKVALADRMLKFFSERGISVEKGA